MHLARIGLCRSHLSILSVAAALNLLLLLRRWLGCLLNSAHTEYSCFMPRCAMQFINARKSPFRPKVPVLGAARLDASRILLPRGRWQPASQPVTLNIRGGGGAGDAVRCYQKKCADLKITFMRLELPKNELTPSLLLFPLRFRTTTTPLTELVHPLFLSFRCCCYSSRVAVLLLLCPKRARAETLRKRRH